MAFTGKNLPQTLEDFVAAVIALPDTLPYVENGGVHFSDPSTQLCSLAGVSREMSAEALFGSGDPGSGFSPAASLKCLSDYVRTRRFGLGVIAAVRELRERFPSDRLRFLEAGGGALPFMSLLAAATDPALHVTILEINEASARYARTVIQHFGIDDRVEVICTDATTFMPTERYHALVSETIDTGLRREPVARILGHLRRFVIPGGFILPHEILLEGGCAPFDLVEGLQSGYSLPYGTLIPVLPDFIFTQVVRWRTCEELLQIVFTVKARDRSDLAFVQRGTITIFDAGDAAITLGPHDSAITMPFWEPVPDVGDVVYCPGCESFDR